MEQREIDAFGSAIRAAANGDAPPRYARIADVPTDILATRFVGMLILAKGNINKWQAASEMLIREIRGEPHPR